jgi:CubicO group peptidase (beta-lactamase class C family)
MSGMPSDVYLRPRTYFSGGGGRVSTAHDYLRFCRMLLADGATGGRSAPMLCACAA